MKTVNVHEAKTTLSRLLEEVERGETLVIARNGKPIAELTAIKKKTFAEAVRDFKAVHKIAIAGRSIPDLINEGRR